MGVDTTPKEPLHLESLVFTWLTSVLDDSQGCAILLTKVSKKMNSGLVSLHAGSVSTENFGLR